MPWEEERNSATSACTKKQIRSQQRTWDSRNNGLGSARLERLERHTEVGHRAPHREPSLANDLGNLRSRPPPDFTGVWPPWLRGAPRRGGKPRLQPAPAPRQHAVGPIPIPGGHPGCRGCRPDVGCTDVSAKHINRDVDCSRGAEAERERERESRAKPELRLGTRSPPPAPP